MDRSSLEESEPELGKRKHDDDLQVSKRQTTESLSNAFSPSALQDVASSVVFGSGSIRSEILPIPQKKVSSIIGAKGCIIQEIQTRTACRLMLDQNFPDGIDRQLHLSGDVTQLESAKMIINKILAEGPQAIHALSSNNNNIDQNIITHTMDCPQVCIGKIIGKGGEVIRQLQMRSGVRINIDQNFPDGMPRRVSLTGNLASVQLAIEMIRQAIDQGPAFLSSSNNNTMSSASSNASSSSATNLIISSRLDGSSVITCPKAHVGKIIGRGGDTINKLQSLHQVNVKINQMQDPVEILVTGLDGNCAGVPRAVLMIQEIVNSSNSYNRGSGGRQGQSGQSLDRQYGAIGAIMHPPPTSQMPPVVECKTSEGHVYYYDPVSKTSSWVKLR